MGITHYLAMTALELHNTPELPPHPAWMACHFSPYGTGISNLPQTLPAGSLLILDDITPIHDHDPERIAAQLQQTADALECSGVLLDFQRPDYPQSAALARYLTESLSCPAAVSALYAPETEAAVLLPPPPCYMPLADYLSPWEGREIWLEAALSGDVLTLTEAGCRVSPLPRKNAYGKGFAEARLHCRYRTETGENALIFTLWRTPEDLDALLREAESLGITRTVGLYQELGFPHK